MYILLSFLIAVLVIYFIDNLICYKRKKILYVLKISGKHIKVLNKSYYNMQFLFGVLICLIQLFEFIFIYDKMEFIYFSFVYMFTFHLINYLFKIMTIKLKFIEENRKDV